MQNSQDVLVALKKILKKYKNKKIGILLSSGIDSIILASFLPKNTIAYTAKYIAPNAIDESIHAKKITKYLGIKHKIIEINWNDFEKHKKQLMLYKKAPLHPSEIGLYKIALQAKRDGIKYLVVGNGADAIFGGMDKLLSKDWSYKEFIARYNILNSKNILKKSANINNIYQKYKNKQTIDTVKFIREIFSKGIQQMYENAISAGKCKLVAPFEQLQPVFPLDVDRIRNGEPKYIIQEVYKKIFPTIKPIPKIPFSRPLNYWMKDWHDIHRSEFKKNIDFNSLNGEQKWLIYCLQDFMDLYDTII